MTDHPHILRPGDQPVSKAGLDQVEIGLLAVFRHFIASFAAPDQQAWTTALRLACDLWGPKDGAPVAVALLEVTDAMRRARRSMFHFSNPNCPCCRGALTANERHVITLIHAIRRGRLTDARTQAMLLCEGHDTTEVLHTATVLAALLPVPQTAAGVGFGVIPVV